MSVAINELKKIKERATTVPLQRAADVYLELRDIIETRSDANAVERIKKAAWQLQLPQEIVGCLESSEFSLKANGWLQAESLCGLLTIFAEDCQEANQGLKECQPPIGKIILELARTCPDIDLASSMIVSLSMLCEKRDSLCRIVANQCTSQIGLLLRSKSIQISKSAIGLVGVIANAGPGCVEVMCRGPQTEQSYDLLNCVAINMKRKDEDCAIEAVLALRFLGEMLPMNLLFLAKNQNVMKTLRKLERRDDELGEYSSLLLTEIEEARDRQDLIRKQNKVRDKDSAAALIQALYRGDVARREWKKMRHAALIIQRNWKNYVDREMIKRTKVIKEQSNLAETQRKKIENKLKMREKELALIDSLPAKAINTFMQLNRDKAIVKIQALWRGKLVRKKMRAKQNLNEKDEAARIIQRFFKSNKQKKEKVPFNEFAEKNSRIHLSDERAAQLQRIILEKRYKNREKQEKIDRESLKELHEKVQSMLESHHKNRVRKVMTRIERENSQKETQQIFDRLLHCDSLEKLETVFGGISLSENDLKKVNKEALARHRRAIEVAEKPWWKTLDAVS